METIINAATLTGLATGIGWIAKKMVKEALTADASSNVMNYAKFTAVMASSVSLKQYLEYQKIGMVNLWYGICSRQNSGA